MNFQNGKLFSILEMASPLMNWHDCFTPCMFPRYGYVDNGDTWFSFYWLSHILFDMCEGTLCSWSFRILMWLYMCCHDFTWFCFDLKISRLVPSLPRALRFECSALQWRILFGDLSNCIVLFLWGWSPQTPPISQPLASLSINFLNKWWWHY